MEGDVEGAKTSLENLEESSSEKQLKFYRSMTTYVHNMVECLQEKVRKEKLTFTKNIFTCVFMVFHRSACL